VKSIQKQCWMKVRPLAVARLLVASILTASFLITVAPLGTASSASAGPMDCCAGKPGHVPGSCATGLLASAKKSQSASSASSGHDPASTSEFSLEVVAGVGAGEHCHTPAAGTPTFTITMLAGPEAGLTTDEFESGPVTVEATAAPTAESGLPRVQTVSQPCTENCGACSTSITRRPREQSTLSFAARPHIPSVRTLSSRGHLQTRSLNRKWLRLGPRAPPA
jgi:hypothetical protein